MSYNKVKNAGKYNHKINIYETQTIKDADGFQSTERVLVLSPYANVKTTKGMTLIKNGSDFEKALTNFTIRFPLQEELNRDMEIDFKGKTYTIEYLNNIDEADVEVELQCKEVEH